MWSAFNAFEFWKCARGKRDERYWREEFETRRARAMGIPLGWRKFR